MDEPTIQVSVSNAVLDRKDRGQRYFKNIALVLMMGDREVEVSGLSGWHPSSGLESFALDGHSFTELKRKADAQGVATEDRVHNHRKQVYRAVAEYIRQEYD